jgi:membrane peptidoglycan carboxypeptidase
MPYTYSAKHLRGPFSLEREVGKDDQPLEITLTPMSQGFSEFDAISPNVPIAFITSEDAGFWSHEGIDTFSIENAIRKNLEERRVTIGGSTITMQTVKNLFLSHRRTISRKLQELFLAWHIENVVDKQRILEIYMNIAEFGPGIYGVTNAAEHYFGKHPFDLNLKESAFLAALLPSPKRRYRHFCNGRPTEEFKEIVDSVLTRVLKLGKIEFGRYQRAKSSELEFNAESRLKSSACARLALSDADRDEDLR